jgi:dienelactone hydrolase
MSYPSLVAETVAFPGHNGDRGEAYYARPTRAGQFPGMVVIHHLPGWDEWIIEVTRKFAHHGAHHGYVAVASHLYFRDRPETDCVAGVVGLELRNPLGSKSARVAAGSSGDFVEMAHQRLFAFELRRGEHAAAARISDGVARAEPRGRRSRCALLRLRPASARPPAQTCS